jgi:soluble lytic murein transglycosylase-like protein
MGDVQNITGSQATQRQSPVDDKGRQKLQRATKEFESLLVGYMLKSMRSSMSSNELFGESYGGDMFEGMFDNEMAQHVSRNSSFGLAEMLYRRMTGEQLPATHTGPRQAAAQSTTQVRQKATADTTAKTTVPVAPTAADTTTKEALAATQATPVVVLSREDAQNVKSAARDSVYAVSDTVRRRLDQVAPFIQEAADTHGVDANLLKAVIATESRGDTLARSPKNAKGLMQLIDSTATAMGVKNVWDARENVMGGAKYLSRLMAQFNGDQEKVLASYNAGPGTVVKHGGIPPYKETRDYVDKVKNYLRAFEQEE